MKYQRPCSVALFAFVCLALSTSAASSERTLHAFRGTPDGATPFVRVIADASGNLYGSTVLGGKFGDGCIFELRPSANGGWHESILYNFSGPDGSSPDGSLVFDTAGNLYGTTAGGGTHGGGVVFELSPTSSGPWTETILHNFGNGTDSTDGYDPQAEMVFDSAGNLFGTTQFGGTGSGFENGGTVFRLSPSADGWNYSQLYSFPGSYSGPDGNLPAGGLAIDQSGNLFGVAQAGGANGSGAVYELSPVGDGTYTEKIIFSFNGNNGRLPNSTPVFDSAGNLYGTTETGGAPCSCGTVYRLTHHANDTWSETVLFAFDGNDGWEIVGPPVFDSAGNLYAASTAGGINAKGLVFELIPSTAGHWTERILHDFRGTSDGAAPYAGVIIDSAGHLFGTTSGGLVNNGTVFEIIP